MRPEDQSVQLSCNLRHNTRMHISCVALSIVIYCSSTNKHHSLLTFATLRLPTLKEWKREFGHAVSPRILTSDFLQDHAWVATHTASGSRQINQLSYSETEPIQACLPVMVVGLLCGFIWCNYILHFILKIVQKCTKVLKNTKSSSACI